ncbi:hypothetical protein P153DRAFT_413356 [Dothidotthia symphoricarpi CBS 119687]|uniref:Uncharacterized protein n=1 Tax=Dothidotthia symphoricarpi CBS 119687 TaxID=1392245 RepID=A0A6A6ARK6_9PLEO|nr:uncharacterized protein P153DRAFT_413356 [Dothidotthia symphoricarpi CBS 119687]KAF2133625.1 hypothetical protein P153DRAFT_413356 [Dothidotthia symphoricarpi CBS 119687]
MHFSALIIAASASMFSVASAGQVNFYSDTNCQNYIGERHPGSYVTTGGPAGSFSALWVSNDQQACSSTCGPLIICGDSSCSRRRATGLGQCVTFNTGVWARNGCGQDMCNNA